jgi:hypothetical protein
MQQVLQPVLDNVAYDAHVDDLIPVNEDIPEAHHPSDDDRQIGRQPPIALEEIDEFTVRAWLAQARV